LLTLTDSQLQASSQLHTHANLRSGWHLHLHYLNHN